MQRFPFFLFLILFPLGLFAQKSPDCNSVDLRNEEGVQAAEPCIHDLCDKVLSRRIDYYVNKDMDHAEVIIAWMKETPDYTFSLDSNVMELAGGKNPGLFGIYCSCLAKAALEEGEDRDEKALKLLADYIRKEEHGVKRSEKVEAFLKDIEKGNFETYYRDEGEGE